NFVANNIIAHNTAAKESPFINTTGLVLLMHFNNETGESERQLNVTHNISAETNLVLYMPFDSASASEIKPNGSTVLLMHFDNVSGIENDTLFFNNATVGSMLNGTCSGTACPVYNKTNYKFGRSGLEFDGIDDNVTVPDSNDWNLAANDFTIETWIYSKDIRAPSRNIIGQKAGTAYSNLWVLSRQDNGDWRFLVVDGVGTEIIDINEPAPYHTQQNVWQHVAATRTGNDFRIYVDGAVVASETDTDTIPNIAAPLGIGGENQYSEFNGTLDEVAIWNVSLSSQIIAQHSGYGIDRSIYGNNATLMNGSVVNTTNFKFGEAMEFDAVKFNQVRFGKTVLTTGGYIGNFSVEAWIFPKTVDGLVGIVGEIGGEGTEGQFDLQVGENNRPNQINFFRRAIGSTNTISVRSDSVIFPGNWYHIAGTYEHKSSPNMTLYINGVKDPNAQGTDGYGLAGITAELLIGKRPDADATFGWFNGTIDEVALWNKTLSSDLIAQHAGAKIIDYSQYGNNGTRNFNSTSDFGRNFTDGKFSKALLFDGVNDFVNVTSFATGFPNGIFNRTYSAELWLKTEDTRAQRIIIGRRTGVIELLVMLNYPSTGRIEFFTGANGGDENGVQSNRGGLNDNNWHHFVFVRDNSSGTLNMYIDGIQDASKSEVGGPGSVGNIGFYIGHEQSRPIPINGTIDELSIWNVSLSADEIRKHYERGVLKLNLSYRTSQDNVTFTAWTGVSNNTISTITSNAVARYFQYKVDFNTTDARYTPILNNVSINYSSRSNLTIFDDTELRTVIVNELFNFTVNFTDFVNPINGTNINCTLSHNGSGNWNAPIKMDYDAARKVYWYNTSFTNKTIASFNVTCDGTTLGYRLMRTIDSFNVTVARVSNFNGTTTDYNNLNAFDNISNAVIENTVYGKIVWLNPINVTGADLNKNVNISENRAGIIAESLHRTLNSSANVSIYNIYVVTPKILKDGVECVAPECVILSYARNNVTFNVSSFSNFSLSNGTINLTLALNVSTSFTGAAVAVSGKVNLSNGSNLLNHLVRLFLNNVEYYNGLNVTDNSDADFNKSVNKNATVVQGTGGEANVTLDDWDYDPDGNLSVNLTAYWKFDEPTSSNNRSDYKGTNNLNTSGVPATITAVDGIRERAVNLTASNNQFLGIPDNPSISTGDIDFTIAAWVYLDSKGTTRWAISKSDSSGQREYDLAYNPGKDRFEFDVASASGSGDVISGTTGSTSTGRWYFISAWHDSVGDTINIQVDNGEVNSTSYTTGVRDSTSSLRIGHNGESGVGVGHWDGRIDEVALWKRILTQKERSILYNASNSTATPYLAANTFKPYKGNFTSRV
ncbi:LamG domain-containing protein, partial [Candidatus Woesearchaeota archaeon]|nr:LamG domain-containing protein [Candidatus Woesearchaeota archaeon]